MIVIRCNKCLRDKLNHERDKGWKKIVVKTPEPRDGEGEELVFDICPTCWDNLVIYDLEAQ